MHSLGILKLLWLLLEINFNFWEILFPRSKRLPLHSFNFIQFFHGIIWIFQDSFEIQLDNFMCIIYTIECSFTLLLIIIDFEFFSNLKKNSYNIQQPQLINKVTTSMDAEPNISNVVTGIRRSESLTFELSFRVLIEIISFTSVSIDLHQNLPKSEWI